MNARQDRRNPGPSRVASPRRFRIERLGERIAPTRGGKGSNDCPGLSCCGVEP